MFPVIILNVMDAFAWFMLITKKTIVSLLYPPNQLVRFFGAKRIFLANSMDSTMWRVSLQCFTDDVEVMLNEGTW